MTSARRALKRIVWRYRRWREIKALNALNFQLAMAMLAMLIRDLQAYRS